MCDVSLIRNSGLQIKTGMIWQDTTNVSCLEETRKLFCDLLSGWNAGLTFKTMLPLMVLRPHAGVFSPLGHESDTLWQILFL